MEVIKATEARANFAELLRRVSAEGERIVIERRGKQRAVLVPLEDLEQAGEMGEQALSKSELRLKDFVDASSDWFWEMDENCRFSYFSDRFTDVTGVPTEALLGKTREETEIPDLDTEAWERHIADLSAHRSFRGYEHPRAHPNSGTIYLSINGKAIFDEEGTFLGYRGTGSDITERRQAEIALRESEARYRDIFDQSAFGIILSAPDGRWLRVNRKMRDIVGYEESELANFSFRSITHADDLDGLAHLAFGDIPSDDGELRFIRKDGSIAWAFVTVSLIRDTEGKPDYYLTVVENIQRRARIRETLRESEEQLRLVTNNLPALITYMDTDQRFQYVNKTAEEWYGLSTGEVVGKTVAGVFGEESYGKIRHYLDKVLAGEFVKFDETIKYPDGKTRNVQISYVPYFSEEGVLRGYLGLSVDLTAHKKTEAVLKETEMYLSNAIESINEGFVYYDAEARLVFCNNKYREFYPWIEDVLIPGARLEDVARTAAERGQDAEEIADVNGWVQNRLDAFSTGGEAHEQHLRDGRWLLCRESRTSDGGFVGIRTDITERKRAEQELRSSEELFSRTFHSSPFLFAISRPEDGAHYDVNKAWIETTGYSRGEAMAHSALELGIWADATQRERFVARLEKEGSVRDFEAKLRTKDGWEFDVLTAGEYIDVGGEPRLLVVHHDITERKRAEEALKAREAQLSHAHRMAKLGVFVWDNVTDKAIHYSDGLADLLGMSDEQMRKWGESHGSTLEQVIPEDRARYHRVIRDAEKAVSDYDVEYRIRDAAGTLRHWREMGEAITDDQGRLIRTVGTIQDITEAKAAEERLGQAQKMEAVGQLTGGVAHDFNNLLAVIMGNIELLVDRLGQSDPALDPILRASRRGAELTQRLLAFSRQQSLRPQVIDLGALVTGMSDLLVRTLGEAVEIDVAVAPDLWLATADQGQVENALLNLAINARDAMPGGGKLTIECTNAQLDAAYVAKNPEARVGAYAVLAVSDEGIGMSSEVQSHAFEPFFTTKEVGRGSGLGLSMIYGFAKQSGGHVNLYSEEGQGSTVKLYLLRAETEARPAEKSQEQEVPRGAGEMVLVIEDDPDVRALAVNLLEDLGYRVIDVADAASAEQALREGPPVDLVLSDVVLPGGTSGPEFAEQARKTYPDLKIIFMSGYPAGAAERNGFLGSDQVLLNKPFQRRQLANALRNALG